MNKGEMVTSAGLLGSQDTPPCTTCPMDDHVKKLHQLYWKLKEWSKFLTQFSQPTHLVTVATSLYLAMLFYPSVSKSVIPNRPSTVTTLLYMGCFAMHIGTQFWMTFASGLVLFFTLPRQTFGQVQKLLFPKYFFLNSLLSGATLALFVSHHPCLKGKDLILQTWCLLICFLVEVGARVYVVPNLLQALDEKLFLEKRAGVGLEVGHHDPGPLAKCPQYCKTNKRFRAYHKVCAAANVIAMACSTLHLYFLSTKLSFALT